MSNDEVERPALRVMVVDDSVLFRESLCRLLAAMGVDVVAHSGGAAGLVSAAAGHRPDVVVLDVRMPPTYTDEGLRVAEELRQRLPGTGVLVLSTYTDVEWAEELLAMGGGVGYLLKDRVDDVSAFLSAMERIAHGEVVMDADVVALILRRSQRRSGLDGLTDRETAVLALMAEGLSNVGISQRLYLSPRTVETHIAAVFGKLLLDVVDSRRNRRVLAVLRYLQEQSARPTPGIAHVAPPRPEVPFDPRDSAFDRYGRVVRRRDRHAVLEVAGRR